MDKNHYLVFPQSLKITIILGPLVGSEIKTKGPIGPPRTPARGAYVQEYPLEQWFSIYGQFTHFVLNLVFTAIFCRQHLKGILVTHLNAPTRFKIV